MSSYQTAIAVRGILHKLRSKIPSKSNVFVSGEIEARMMPYSLDPRPYLPMNMQSASIRLLHRFYSIFFFVGSVLLAIGVPFVFYRKVASTVAISVIILAVLIAWRMNRRGQPQKSLIFFAGVMWLIMVALIYAGLT